MASTRLLAMSSCALVSSLVPGITNLYCGPSFETATSRPPQDEALLVETQRPHARVTASPLSLEERATRASRSMGYKRLTYLSQWVLVRAHASQENALRRARKLQHDLAPVRTGTMLDQVDRLPCSQRQFASQDRDVQRTRRQHGLDMRRHVVGAFGAVGPSGVLGRQPVERGHQIVEHRRIGIFLDRQRRRGMTDLGGEIDEAGTGRLNRQERRYDGIGADGRCRR